MTTAPDASPWPFAALELGRAFKRACELLGLGPAGPRRYSLRHGGASEDLFRQRRSVEAVQRRRRWASSQSLKRDGEGTRVLTQLNQVPNHALRFGELVEQYSAALVEEGLTGSGAWSLVPTELQRLLRRPVSTPAPL
ncbi:unnamed protein product [Prorocentrum cordatum]|uniref:Uncharacterized protein n=1 Tax=Prorocentrum cordatum TaxID=2364126 RepID=A0ABN9RWB3_9DINO|nr:unnamed protein product [Polarella glacialis]